MQNYGFNRHFPNKNFITLFWHLKCQKVVFLKLMLAFQMLNLAFQMLKWFKFYKMDPRTTIASNVSSKF